MASARNVAKPPARAKIGVPRGVLPCGCAPGGFGQVAPGNLAKPPFWPKQRRAEIAVAYALRTVLKLR